MTTTMMMMIMIMIIIIIIVFIPCLMKYHALKASWEVEPLATFFWNFGASCQLHTTAGYPLVTISWYTLYVTLSGPQSQSGRFGEEKNLLPLPKMEPQFPCRPGVRLVTVPTKLCLLRT